MIEKVILNGRSGSGKDTVADYLVSEYGFKKFYFAEMLYEIAYKYFDMKGKDMQLLIDIGNAMRSVDKDIIIDYMDRIISESRAVRVVISDCRFPKEYDKFVGEYGYFPVRIVADFEERSKRLAERDGKPISAELSEDKTQVGADEREYYTIRNDGTLQELKQAVDEMITQK